MVRFCVLTALLAVVPSPQARGPESSDSALVVIDGKKNPSQIPEWLVWEHAFMQIAMLKGKETSFTESLRKELSAEEFGLLEREALAHDQRSERAIKEIEPLREEYQKADHKNAKAMSALNDRVQNVNLTYRRATLDARDRVLQSLGPTSQSVVLSWIGDLRATIIARVSKGDVERWRAPE